ncbi:MAG: WYL domain-containing protein [Myxococcota bacterium]|jgi:proteasome accessory factor B|nr:WYL domain-containing protein [Myxococcota bacterium]
MPDIRKHERLHQLHQAFVQEHARLTVGRIMADYGVNRRTVNRDLEELRLTYGLELKAEKLDGGENLWHLPSRAVRVTYNITDLMALFLGRRLFDFLEGTLLEDSLRKVYGKIEAQLHKDKDLITARELSRRVHLVSEGPKKLQHRHVACLDEVLDALLRNRHLAVTYRNVSGKTSKFTVLPYTLVAFRRGLYLLAAFEDSGNLSTLALERMTAVKSIKGTSFELPVDYDPQTLLDSALFLKTGKPTKVELVFDAGSADFIRIRRFHHSQKLRALEDGRLFMTLRVPAEDDDFEIENFVLSFGPYVEVRSPQALRNRVAASLTRALDKYR